MRTLIEWDPEPDVGPPPPPEAGPYVIIANGEAFKGFIDKTETNAFGELRNGRRYDTRKEAEATVVELTSKRLPSNGGPYTYIIVPVSGAAANLGGYNSDNWPTDWLKEIGG